MKRACAFKHPNPAAFTTVCSLCRWWVTHAKDDAVEYTSPPPPAVRVPAPPGPGTKLKELLAEIGVKDDGGCGCRAYAAQMDAWGVDGCRARRAEIVARLKEQWERLGWWDRVKTGVRTVRACGLSDPAGELVDRAIALAETPQNAGV